ncbi:hypothetical protein BGZ46_000510 [Entomortierella lignicola]|nr:hypothetical protein BGZ46_000510 [Entomortierella lignicola]
MTMAFLPSNSPAPFTIMSSHISKPSRTSLSSSSSSFPFIQNVPTQEQILTAPELRSMDQSELYPDLTSFSNGILSQDFNFLPQQACDASSQYQAQFHPFHFRHSFQGTTAHQDETSRFMMFGNDMTNQVLDSSNNVVNGAAAIDMNTVRGGNDNMQMTHKRRTQSLEANPTVPSMTMTADVFSTCGDFFAAESCHSSISLPTSPAASSLECSPAQATPEFLPSLVVDGQPHPFFIPSTSTSSVVAPILASTENDSIVSSSPSLSNTLSATSPFQSPNSASTSPLLSPPSASLKRKRFSTDCVVSSAPLSVMNFNANYHVNNNFNINNNSNHHHHHQQYRHQRHHSEGAPVAKKVKPRYVCHVPDCNRTFSRPYNLKSHGLTHDTHRPYACTKCSKSFARIHDRDRHMNSHMAEKPHVCIVCMGRFARQDAVIRHLKLSNETNACSWILKNNNISFRDAAAGRVTREALGEESKIQQTLETLEEHARKARATKTLELMTAAIEANNASKEKEATAASSLEAIV